MKFIKKTLLFIGLLLISSLIHANEWQVLFNGKNLDNWTVKINHHEVGVNFGDTFRVEENMIKVRYDQYQSLNNQFGHLYYDEEFSNFHLKLDYRFSGEPVIGTPSYAINNSGVMFYSQSPYSMLKEQNWPISVEMQFLAKLDGEKPRTTGNMCSPGTNVVFNQKTLVDHCLNSISATYAKNEWVSAELIVNKGKITQIINGNIVLEYFSPTISRQGLIKGAKENVWQEGKLLTKGYIALQSEGQPIEFKNIILKKL